jgi:hypothetical protein
MTEIVLAIESREPLTHTQLQELAQRIMRPLWSDIWNVMVRTDGKLVVQVVSKPTPEQVKQVNQTGEHHESESD